MSICKYLDLCYFYNVSIPFARLEAAIELVLLLLQKYLWMCVWRSLCIFICKYLCGICLLLNSYADEHNRKSQIYRLQTNKKPLSVLTLIFLWPTAVLTSITKHGFNTGPQPMVKAWERSSSRSFLRHTSGEEGTHQSTNFLSWTKKTLWSTKQYSTTPRKYVLFK